MGFAVTTYTNQTPVVGLLSSRISSEQELLNLNTNQTTLGVNQDRYNKFLEPCQVIDSKVIDFLNDINTDKNTIVTNGNSSKFQTYSKYYSTFNQASNAVISLYDGVLSEVDVGENLKFTALSVNTVTNFPSGAAVTSSTGGSGTVLIEETSQVGVAFSVIVGNVSGSFGVGSTIYVAGVAFTSLSSIDYVGTGQIYSDNTILTYYPDLEPANSSVENPFGDLRLKILSNSTKGLGFANTFYANSLENSTNPNGDFVDSDDTISLIGKVYAFNTISGSTEKSNIDNLIVNIENNRTSLSSFNNSSSTIKNLKKGYSVNIWSLEKSNDYIQSNITDLQSAIAILEDPANGGPY